MAVWGPYGRMSSITLRLLTLDDAPVLAGLLRVNRDFLTPWEPIRGEEYFTVDGHHANIREARTRKPPSGSSATPIATAVCEPLCGRRRSSLPPSATPSSSSGRTVAGMPDSGAAGVAPLLSHTTARPDGRARRYSARPHAAGRRSGSQPIGPLNATAKAATPTWILNQAARRAFSCPSPSRIVMPFIVTAHADRRPGAA
jgi:hypothetical protein